ncbi:hypothetical protein BJP36_43755 [Moorena producens JHB]|uniref:Uncharacterized protein n=1 Tax=Moorena producens (strain JHB) TaxID=1454205 RepID=A0A9Q9STC2_MOOP1|nr:hypothetical protein [Moorena producens]WAN69279.1 hypothetical protein BJP36_43755 [Moorena producens JHB]
MRTLLEVRSPVSGQLCGTGFGLGLSATRARLATLCERRWDLTQIKQMVTCCLDPKREWGKPRQSASGGNPPMKALPPQDRAASPRPLIRASPQVAPSVAHKLNANS